MTYPIPSYIPIFGGIDPGSLPEPKSYPCPYCDTWGDLYYRANDGEQIDREHYDALTPDMRCEEKCAYCEGEGWYYEEEEKYVKEYDPYEYKF